MSYNNGLQYTDFKKINLKDGLMRFANAESAPTSTTGEYLLYMYGGVLYFDNGSSAVALGAGSSGSVGSLDGAYDGGRTITVNQGAITFNGVNEDTAVLALTGDGDSAGALLTFSHTTATRNDVLGTGSTWLVTGQGKATFVQMAAPTIVSATSGNTALTIDAAGTGTITIGGTSTGAVTITPALTATASVTITGTGGSNVLTVTAGDVVLSDGSITVTDADNAATIKVINNTATTIGASAADGLVEFASTSLTTGTLLHLELTEGTLNGGHYLKCWDATAGAAVFTLGENGDVAITGTAAANAFTITAGDVLMSDGSLTMTDADNAATLSITNNTATTASVFVFAGSGAFTGTTTTSFMTITPSGLTTGTGVYVVGAAMTTGQLVHLVGSGATAQAGSEVLLVAAGAATVGQAISVTNTGVYTGTGVVTVTADSATTGSIIAVSGAGITSGSILKLSATEATLTTGFYIQCYDGAANDFTVAKYGATTIAGNALGTAALTLTKGDIVVSDGNLQVTGKVIFNATETIAAGGTSTALSLSKTVHHIDADAGGDTFTLADGTTGQIMYITMESATGTATITPASFASGTSITFNAAGDSVVLLFIDAKWYIIGGNSYTIV